MQNKGEPHPLSVIECHNEKKTTLQILWQFSLSCTARTVSAVNSINHEHKCATGRWKDVKVVHRCQEHNSKFETSDV